MHPHHLQAAQVQIKEESSNKFKTTRKMGSESMSTLYFEEFSSKVDELYDGFVKQNDSKKLSLLEIVLITSGAVVVGSGAVAGAVSGAGGAGLVAGAATGATAALEFIDKIRLIKLETKK